MKQQGLKANYGSADGLSCGRWCNRPCAGRRLPMPLVAQRFDDMRTIVATANAQSAGKAGPATAQQLIWSPFPRNARFETGERWIAEGRRQRLFGIQACLRGTRFTNAAGVKVDCGEAIHRASRQSDA